MSYRDWNRITHGKPYKKTAYPTRWFEVDPETGSVMGKFSGVEKPRPRDPSYQIVEAIPPEYE